METPVWNRNSKKYVKLRASSHRTRSGIRTIRLIHLRRFFDRQPFEVSVDFFAPRVAVLGSEAKADLRRTPSSLAERQHRQSCCDVCVNVWV